MSGLCFTIGFKLALSIVLRLLQADLDRLWLWPGQFLDLKGLEGARDSRIFFGMRLI